jgi:hypothetical protein
MKRSIGTTVIGLFMWLQPANGEIVQVQEATGQEFSASAKDLTGAVLEQDLVTGEMREAPGGSGGAAILSPDGRLLAAVNRV